MGAWQQKKERKGCRAREAQANCCQYVCNANKLYLIKGTRVTDTPRPLPRTNVLRRGCSCQAGPISLFIQPYSTLPPPPAAHLQRHFHPVSCFALMTHSKCLLMSSSRHASVSVSVSVSAPPPTLCICQFDIFA